MGYSFFSDAEDTGRSSDFALFGEEVESEVEEGDLFPGEGESGGEFEFEVAIDNLRLHFPVVSLLRRLSRDDSVK